MRKSIAIMMIVSLLTPLLGGIIQIETANAAPAGTEVKYNLIDDPSDYEYGGLIFSVNKSKNTAPIQITAPAGKVIKSLMIYGLDGEPLRSVKGFTPGSKSFNGTETFQGTRLRVQSLDNGHYGTIYYWDRRSGSNNWNASNEQFSSDSDDCGRPGVPDDEFGLRKFPGCTDNRLESKIPLTNGFFLTQEEDNSPGKFWIPNKAVSPAAGDLDVDYTEIKTRNAIGVTLHDRACTHDPTTSFLGVKYPSEIGDSLSLRYSQSFESFPFDTTGDKQYKDWAAPGARQIWYCAKFEADFYSYTYMYQDKKIYVEYQDEDTPPGGGGDPGGGTGGGSGSCSWTIASPSQGSSPQTSYMNPNATGVIRADNRGNERFNVLQGIPTSETLYANVFANNYIFQHTFANMSGKVNYSCSVDVTYVLNWKVKQPDKCDAEGNCTPQPDKPMTETTTRTYTFTLQRDYSYWEIKNIEVYGIDRASVSNYALPSGGTVFLYPTGYSAPTLSTTHSSSASDHVRPKNTGTISYNPPAINGGYSKPSPPNDQSKLKSMAESQTGDPDVRNDTVTFNGSTIMNGNWTTKTGPTPGKIPAPSTIGANVLYSSGLNISSSLTNANNTPSSGTIYYDIVPGYVNGGSDKQFSINGINTVTVHTPVVNYSSVSNDSAHNQKTVPTAGRSALILDRPFTVTIPTSGQHQNYLNYGNRDYAKWTRDRQVRFEFGVLTAPNDNSTYIPPGTWISFPAGQATRTFYLPVWVDEGYYNIYTRTIAENAPSSFTTETDANMNLQNHVATRTLPVEVIGRIYDFRVTDIADFNWETVFRTAQGSSNPRGNYYPVGENGIDGAPNGRVFPYELPIRRGSHPAQGYKNVAVKMGYHFKFDVKTKGNMFGTYDSVRVVPRFYFVDMNGNRQEVDLYYHTENQKFIRIGSAADLQKRYVTLDARLRNVPQSTISNTAGTLYDLFASSSGWSMSRSQYITDYLAAAKKGTVTGGYDVNLLTAPLRTFIGGYDVPSGVSSARKNAAVQQWYGEYSIPAQTYVVPKGTNLAEYGRKNKLDEKAPIFLKKGFIIVNFDLMTIRNGNLNSPHLQYINTGISAANQWRREGFNHQFTDPYGLTVNLIDGDVILYHADKSSNDDLGAGGTH